MKSIAYLIVALFITGCSLGIDLNDLSIPLPVTTGTVSFDLKGKSYNLSQPTLTLPSDVANFFGFGVDALLTDRIQLQFYSWEQKTLGQNIEVNFDQYTSAYFNVFYNDSLYQSGNIYGTHGKAYMLIEELTDTSAKGTFHFTIGRAEGDTLKVTNGKFDLIRQ